MPYHKCRTQVINMLIKVLAVPRKLVQDKLGTQSLRSGGASSVAHRVPDRVFQRHGAWASADIKNEYVKDPREVRLATTKAIGY
mmetsp:Transcript_4126/g.10002  ORF Transcript_4126/g.10002 Transcript_4126/m.10002 type:complete len:84 (-) Transcript_4126:392-643(-)